MKHDLLLLWCSMCACSQRRLANKQLIMGSTPAQGFSYFFVSFKIFQTLGANYSYIGSFLKMFDICIKSAYKMQQFLFSNIWRSVA